MCALPLLAPEHLQLGVDTGTAPAKENSLPTGRGEGELEVSLFPGMLLKLAQNTQFEKC